MTGRGPAWSLVVVAAAACTAPESPAPSTTPGDDTATTPSVPPPRPTLTTVPDAPDLDPAEGAVRVALTADVAVHTVGDAVFEGYAYEGTAPGPLLRARVGDVLTVDFTNALLASTTIHWHGVAAPFAMDGVTWLTAPVPELSSFTYVVPLDHAGTFWYHPHIDVDHQVDLGLYGPLVVEDPADPVMDELVLVFDAWGEVAVDEHGLVNPADQVWTVNGLVDPVLRSPAGLPQRVRIVNAANTGYLDLTWPGATVVGGDQGLAATDTPASLLLAPGDRVELVWTVAAADVVTNPYVPAGGGEAWGDPRRVFSVEPEGEATGEVRLEPPDALPSPDPAYTDLVYVFSGGDADAPWLINGESWPDVTAQTAPLGAPTVIEVRNLSATEHPFHLHGNAFEVLSLDGVPPAHRLVADTFNVPIRSTARLLLTPENPGDWMLHCHLLEHEEGGMMTLLRVE